MMTIYHYAVMALLVAMIALPIWALVAYGKRSGRRVERKRQAAEKAAEHDQRRREGDLPI